MTTASKAHAETPLPDHPERRANPLLDPLKRSLRRLPYPVIFHLHQAYYSGSTQLRYERARRELGFAKLSDLKPSELRRSDTAFILGSGASIGEISPHRWEAIRQHDSYAFNFFLRHEHVPTAFAYEGFYEPVSPGAAKRFARIAWERAEDYRDVPMLVTGLNDELRAILPKLPPAFRENVYFAPIVPTYARSDAELRESVSLLRRYGQFRQARRLRSLYKYRASLSLFIVLAHRMGYRNVVLCGVDLRDRRYFYHDETKYPDMVGFGMGTGTASTLHQTMKAYSNQVPIDRVIFALNDLVLKPAGTQLFVENKSSALYPTIPAVPESLVSVARRS